MPQRPFTLSVKALIVDPAGQWLAIRRSARSKNNPGRWDLPGGKCDTGESLEVALARAVAEETGLQVRIIRVTSSAQAELNVRVVAYLVMEAEVIGGAIRLSAEHDAFQWQPRYKLAELAFAPPFVELIRAFAQAGTSRPLDSERYREQIQDFRDVRALKAAE